MIAWSYSNLLDSSLDSTSGPAAFEATAKDLEKVHNIVELFQILINYLLYIDPLPPSRPAH